MLNDVKKSNPGKQIFQQMLINQGWQIEEAEGFILPVWKIFHFS